MKDILNEIGINVGLIISGLSGSLITARKKESWRHQLITIAGGTLSANYITAMIIDLLNITNQNASYGLAFIVGLSGLKIAERLEAWILHQFRIKKDEED
jgi:hypothetical protein